MDGEEEVALLVGEGTRGGVWGAEDGLGEGECEPDGGGEDAPVRTEDVEGGDSRAGGERGIGVGEGEGDEGVEDEGD